MFTCRVPSRPIRAGHAFRAIPSPTASGQRAQMSPRSAGPPKRVSSRRTESDSESRGHLHDLARLGGERRAVCRRDHGLAEPRDRCREDGAAARIELREHVVEQQQRGRGQEPRLGEQEREQRQPLLALRAEARGARGRRLRSRGRRGEGRGRSSRARGPRRSAPPAPQRSVLRRRTRAARPAARAPPGARGRPATAPLRSPDAPPPAPPRARRHAPSTVRRPRGAPARAGRVEGRRSAARVPTRTPAASRPASGSKRPSTRSM